MTFGNVFCGFNALVYRFFFPFLALTQPTVLGFDHGDAGLQHPIKEFPLESELLLRLTYLSAAFAMSSA